MVILGSAFDWMVMNEHGISGLEWGYGVFTAGVSLLAMVLLLFALLLGRRGMGRAALLCRWAVWVMALANLGGLGLALWRMPLLAASLLVGEASSALYLRTYDLLGAGLWVSLVGALFLWFVATWNLPGRVEDGEK